MPQILYLPAIFLIASFTQGVSGFGTALVAMPLLTLLMGVQTATPLCMLNGLIITGYLSFKMRNHISWDKIVPLMIGCLPGIFLGIFFLKNFNSIVLQIMLGIFITVYAVYSLAVKPAPRKLSSAWGYLAGFLTGIIGSAFSAGGPPTIIYVSLSGWNKDKIKAALSMFFLCNGMVTAIGHAASGLTTSLVLQHFAVTAPATIIGVWLGSICYGKIKQTTYIKVMLWLLIVMGGMMIYSAILQK